MRQELMEILVCPMCKGELTLNVNREEGDEVLEGTIGCSACAEEFPIEDGIPNMLPPDLRD